MNTAGLVILLAPVAWALGGERVGLLTFAAVVVILSGVLVLSLAKSRRMG